ncbi:phosphotransferase family protein [Streptomyces aidingensis]|uniref:Ser/Thr protein kinase RdoA involved in Cpx stress response, MazF antagonist n=1 Tax=Streptomyces aidingensis TaxID=910347 RepID=A0A1I1JGX3_9ACTN|nr:phosphotransferase [Streptomyces aidingensis]SFC47869.1 Ser/Thr protein kinase RdoA involved in Cpx stress response, MazF antagonist [Streptomyces aidingensis]
MSEEQRSGQPPQPQPQPPGGLVTALAALAARAPGAAPAEPPGEPVVLAGHPERVVVRNGGAVAKAHAAGTDPAALELRLRVAADPALRGILLPPLGAPVIRPLPGGGRPATLWPYGTPVDPVDPDAAPWAEAGRLLARLHAVPVAPLEGRLGGALPVMRGPARVAEAMARLRACAPGGPRPAAARKAVEDAWAGLPGWCRAEPGTGAAPPSGSGGPPALCHGDFHLGQLLRHPPEHGPWRLIDVDDLGTGEPAWDLARPAAGFAAGFLPPEDWRRLLDAYQEESGTAGRDPWPALDPPARAVTVQLAALSLVRAGEPGGGALDEDDESLIDACVRISRLVSGGSI